jgi:hypothetical protein
MQIEKQKNKTDIEEPHWIKPYSDIQNHEWGEDPNII